MKVRTRLLAMMLAIVMIISILPVGALAGNGKGNGGGHGYGHDKELPAEGVSTNSVVVIAGSDFQDPGDNDANASASSNNVKSILNQIKIDYATADALIFCGDYDKDLPSADVQKSTTALKNAVNSVFSDVDDFFLVQGNHDQVTQGTNGLTGPGAHDTTDYGVYIIDEDDYQWSSGANEGKIKTTAASLKSYLNGKISAGYTKPIFVASHVPLHFSPRTQEGDGKYAKYIFDELQAGGEAGLTIIFLYGHDHSQGWDNYMGGAAVYLPKGHDINIANVGSGTVYGTYTLNFNYMNAGFVGYYADWEPETDYKNKDSGVDKTKTMSVFEITDSEVTVKRYDENGVHVLKSEGKENVKHTTRTQCPLMTDVLTSPQTISLTSVPPVNPPETDDTVYTGTYEYAASAEAGKEYLLVSNGYALQNDNGVVSAAKVKVNDDGTLSVDETASEASLLWEFNESSFDASGDFTVSNDGLYVGRESGDAEQTMKLLGTNDTYYTAWSYVDGSVLRQVSGSSSDYIFYAYARNGSFYVNHSEDINEAGYDYTLKLYEKAAEPEEPTAKTFTDDATGIKVTTTSGTGLEVALGSTEETYAFLSEYVAYDITVADFAQGTEATVSIPLPEGYDTDKTVVYYRAESGELTDMNATVENGVVTFTTTHFSTYVVGQTSVNIGNWVEVKIPGKTKYTYTLDTDGINSGDSYLIADRGSANILWDNYGIASKSVTISNNKIVLDSDNYDWTVTLMDARESSYRIQNGDRYLKIDNTYKLQINTDTSYSYWTLVKRDGGLYRFKAYSAGNYYIQYNNNKFSATNDANSGYKRFFRLTGTETTTETYYLGLVSEAPYSFPTSRFANRTALETYLKNQINVVKADDTNGTNAEFVDYTLAASGTVNPTAAGTTTYTVKYNGHEVGTVTVTFVAKNISNIELNETEGSVYRGAKTTASTGAKLTVYYDDQSTEQVDITLAMLSGNFDRNTVNEDPGYTDLTVEYEGKKATGFTLYVLPNPAENDYPEYPHEGSVRVNKTGSPIDWLSTGVAKVELSATGVPMQKGVDVIIMLDTSSSMKDAIGSTTRIAVLRQSLKNMLKTFSTPDATTGVLPDIRVAVADFNGYTNSSTSPYKFDSNDICVGGEARDVSTDYSQVYTGNKSWTAGAFDDASEYADETTRNTLVNGIQTHSGTNYDAAFYNTYQLGQAITAANKAAGEDRDLYVVFMSDGAPFQYNGFSSMSEKSSWNTWLQGIVNNAATGTHSYFYNGTGNKHRWAEAIKGSSAKLFTVIDKTKNTTGDNAYLTQVKGLEATMYSIGFCLAVDKQITVESMEHVLKNIATNETYYHKADTAADLDNAFTQIASNIRKAGYNAAFVDKMGSEYDLKLTPFTLADKTTSMFPSIEVSTYELYKASDVNGTTVTEAMVGTRKSSTPTVLERVTFNEAGTEAYSNKMTGTNVNILRDGVICAQNFYYNTTNTAVVFEDEGITIQPESFYWIIGDITEDEKVLSYYVYLTGSMEGSRPEGYYPTNESATLYYKNWLDHDAHKDTVSPILPWGVAAVSYAFYLVDENGNTINSAGQQVPFANRVNLTQPVVYKDIFLNSDASINAALVASELLPTGLELYDPDAAYNVVITSDNIGSGWVITKGPNNATTYVTDYNGSDFSNTLIENNAAYDYTHTTVWFAVKTQIKCVPDVVVIDYGLPVVISVIENDMFGSYGKLTKVVNIADVKDMVNGSSPRHENSVGDSDVVTRFGDVKMISKKVTYTPNTMSMTSIDTFAYEVQYSNPEAAEMGINGYYYGAVTVVPATTIYYEDSFVTFKDDAKGTDESGKWTLAGTENTEATQAEDRPGFGNLSDYDANNIYGFDQAYQSCSTYSNGSAKKVTVDATVAPTAEFVFTGTAFDIISVTSGETGTIIVDVYKGTEKDGVVTFPENEDDYFKEWIVDTYYGYNYVSTGYCKQTWTYDGSAWHVVSEPVESIPSDYDVDTKLPASPSVGETCTLYDELYQWERTDSGALYQIPVIKSPELDYGTYKVIVRPLYAKFFDHTAAEGSYDFYFDAVRVYAPADADDDNYSTIENAYKADNEAYPQFIELRKELLGKENFTEDTTKLVNGAVFIDGFGVNGTISQYENFGPNNEIYLAKGQSVAFKLNSLDYENIATVQIAAKAVNGNTALKVNNWSVELNTATDRYYNITNAITWKSNESDTIVLTNNNADAIVSLTNVKITYKEEPKTGDSANQAPTMMVMSRKAADDVAMMLFSNYVAANTAEPEEEEPIIVEPEVFEPAKVSVNVTGKNFKVGDTVSATITTSSDVASLTLNGIAAKLKKTNKKTGEKTWIVSVKASAVGDMILSVVAYDSEGAASEPIQSTITVTAKNGNGKKAKP